MIPPETIEQVRQANDIAQVLGEFVRLKKKGRNFEALCPFHTEKTPSFKVSVEKQIYHCFGCGKGGNVFSFLMEHEKLTFVEAVRQLAAKANITIREQRSDIQRDSLDRLHFAQVVALEYFQNQIESNKNNKTIIKYLDDKRGISKESIKFFQIGYAPEGWDGLISYAKTKELSASELLKAGLVSHSPEKKRYYDRFRQRLMFPIFNLSNKPIAFGGRALRKGESAKYINSPETQLYTKGNVLYGLNSSRDSVRTAGEVFVVEGYFDVISLWQAGIQNVVASSGTAFTAQQARLLARFAEKVILFFDADSAGQVAALRSVGTLFDAGIDVSVIVPPSGEDPDSLARKFGRERIDELRESALPYIKFRMRRGDTQNTGLIGREKLVKEFRDVGNRISDPTRRALFYQQATEALGVNGSQFLSVTKGKGINGTLIPATAGEAIMLEKELISLLLSNPGSVDIVLEKVSPEDFDSRQLGRLYAAIVQQYQSRGEINAHQLLTLFADDEPMVSSITNIVSIEWQAEVIEQQTRDRMKEFVSRSQKRIRARLMHQLREAEDEKDQSKAEEIMREIKAHGLQDA